MDPFKIVFADDDEDDHLLFQKALDDIAIPTQIVAIKNGEKLMKHLLKNLLNLPDVIFLDLNMPRKTGTECLTEIKKNKKLRHIPIIIYSTGYHTDILDLLYKYGAVYCIRKSGKSKEIKKNITLALQLIIESKGLQPAREKFTLGFKDDK